MSAESDRRIGRRNSAIALGTALAPFVVQGATLLLTGSTALTLLFGGLLAAAVVAAAFVFQARVAGGWERVPLGTRVGIALAVVTYHVIAFPFAHILRALLATAP